MSTQINLQRFDRNFLLINFSINIQYKNIKQYPLTTDVLKKQVRERPKYDDDATAFLSVPFNSDELHTVRKPLTRAFQIYIG